MKAFTIQNLWNEKVRVEKRLPKVRNYISPSDLGGSMIDRYYKMKGEPPTNPFDERILRVFDAGRLFEWIITRTFAMSGILLEKQFKISLPATPDRFEVWGYGDAIIGGTPNWQMARDRIKTFLNEYKLKLDDEVIESYSMKLIDGLEKTYPLGIKEKIIIEAKSINSMAFWSHKNRDKDDHFLGYDHHKLQTYAYLMGRPDAHHANIFYISKDDLCLQELPVYRTVVLSEAFLNDTRMITHYIKENITPPREPDILFNPKKRKYEPNWKAGRSLYLTKITGIKDQETWEANFHQELLDVNRAIKHIDEKKVKDEDKIMIEKYKLEELLKGGDSL